MKLDDLPGTRLEWHLENWREWMGRGQEVRGYKCAVGFSRSGSMDFETMADASDNRCASTVDAIIDSLTPVEQCAIHHQFLNAVFRFPRGFDAAIESALDKIETGLDKWGIY